MNFRVKKNEIIIHALNYNTNNLCNNMQQNTFNQQYQRPTTPNQEHATYMQSTINMH